MRGKRNETSLISMEGHSLQQEGKKRWAGKLERNLDTETIPQVLQQNGTLKIVILGRWVSHLLAVLCLD